jgi:hypothetical protein
MEATVEPVGVEVLDADTVLVPVVFSNQHWALLTGDGLPFRGRLKAQAHNAHGNALWMESEAPPPALVVSLYEVADGWHWRLRAADKSVLADGVQPYPTIGAAAEAATASLGRATVQHPYLVDGVGDAFDARGARL